LSSNYQVETVAELSV